MRLVALAVLLLLPGAARAGDPGLVALFERFCLVRFPAHDPAGDAGAGSAESMEPMPAEQVRQFLHDDPGRGWFVDEGDAQYALTIEDPPYKACAIRRVYENPPDLLPAWVTVSKNWARRTGRAPFGATEPRTVTRDGAPITVTLMRLPATATATVEVFMALTTNNADGTTELRLVRDIPDTPPGG